jgi:L-ascorbate metabolism protein UlaG (beta-lactamase superfamily)
MRLHANHQGAFMMNLRRLVFALAFVATGCTTTSMQTAAPMVRAMPASTPHTAGKTEVLWLGQSATRITTPDGKVIVIDPWLINNPKTPAPFKNLDALGKVDLILVTHAHGDHFEDAPALANKNNVPIIAPQGLQSTLISLNLVPAPLSYRMGKGGTAMPLPGVKVTMVHAEHDSELTWTNPATGKRETHAGGEPVGYIIEMENGFKIWHTGDTGPFTDMRLIAETWHPDLLMLPIGGHFVMSPADAAMATREWIKPRYALPIHYGTTPQLAGTPAQYQAALGASPVQMLAVDPGQKVEF